MRVRGIGSGLETEITLSVSIERRRVRAQPLVEIDRDLASVLQSRKSGRPALSSVSERKQSMNLTSSDDEARKRF